MEASSMEFQLTDDDELLFDLETRTMLVKELTETVSELIEAQEEPINEISENTNISIEQLVDGVKLLAKARYKEVSKYKSRGGITIGAVGTVVGLAASGPIGMLVGALSGVVLGGYAGASLTTLAQNNITYDIIKLDKLLNLKIVDSETVMTKLSVYEVERRLLTFGFHWMPFKIKHKRSKVRKYWVSPAMRLLKYDTPNPERFQAFFSKLTAKSFLPLAIGKDLYEASMKQLQMFSWDWGSTEWHIKGDWEYAFSYDSAEWSDQASFASMVRRRKWEIEIVGKVLRSESGVECEGQEVDNVDLKQVESSSKESELPSPLSSTLKRMKEVENQNLKNSESLGRQSEAIIKSISQAKLVRDTTVYAERINRSATLSGIIQNTVSSRGVSQFNFDRKDLKSNNLTGDSTNKKSLSAVDELESSVSTNLKTLQEMNKKVVTDNEQLGKLESIIKQTEANLEKLNLG